MTDTTLTVHFQQRFGAFDRIASLLRRRGFPVSGMTVERTHRQDIGRMTVSVGSHETVEQVRRHLQKLPDVLEVNVHTTEDAVQREYALLRVHCAPTQEATIRAVLERHGARLVVAAKDHMVVEASASKPSMDALFADLSPFGIEESARTNPIALSYTQAAGDARSA